MKSAPFTPEQEARIREMLREKHVVAHQAAAERITHFRAPRVERDPQ